MNAPSPLLGVPLAEPKQEGQWRGGYGTPGEDPGVSHC